MKSPLNLQRYSLLIIVTAWLVVLDQWTKIYIHTHFDLGESITVIPDWFNITYVRNRGAAFGLFRDAWEGFRTVFFMVIPPTAMLIIVFIIRGLKPHEWGQTLALAAIFGGALGNYIDRIRFGYVIDFLDFHIRSYYTWPAFNIADSAIVMGVGFLLLFMSRSAEPSE